MASFERSDVADALLVLAEQAGGEVDVREAELFDRLADLFDLPEEERRETYVLGAGKEVPRWEQTVRVLQQELRRKGLFETGPRRGVWALSPAGRMLARELARRDRQRRAVRPRSSAHALSLIGFHVVTGEDGVHEVRSSLPSVAFAAVLVDVQGGMRLTIPKGNADVLLVAPEATLDGLPFLPEGAMVVPREALDAVALRHQRDPVPLDVLVGALRAAIGDRGLALSDLKEDDGVSADVRTVARLVLNHTRVRCDLEVTDPVQPDHVYWFLCADPATRGWARETIQQALEYLAGPSVGAFRRSEDGFLPVLSPDDALRLLDGGANA